jgi:NAD-dependent DNA ligase
MYVQSEQHLTKMKKSYDIAYAKGKPILHDVAYDQFILKFRKLYPKAKALKDVGAAVGRSEKREKLPIIVGSLDLQRPSDLAQWMESIEKQQPQKGWITEPKFDGTSLTLSYNNDQLDKAFSRGKIIEGESLGYDVTPAAKFIQGVLGRLRNNYLKKKEYIVRGEMIMHASIFKSKYLNKKMPGKPEGYQNARNLCAGLINRKDASEVKDILKDCTFVAYNLFYKNKQGVWVRPFSTHKEWIYLTLAGFTTAVSPVRYSKGHWKLRSLVANGHETLRSLLPVHELGGSLGEWKM